MEKRRIGSLEVSLVGLGCNNFGGRLDAAGTERVVGAALDAGIDFFDTADIYGGTRSEVFLGQALRGRRERAIVATKFGMPVDERRRGARPEYVRQAIEDSLRRLGTDHVDLYQLHQPDSEVPIAETLGALDALVREGKVREIGCSNFSAAQIGEAQGAARGARFASVQNEYSLVERDAEREVLPACARYGLAFLPYFPLGGGLLTGKYARGRTPAGARLAAGGKLAERMLEERRLARVERLDGWVRARGHGLLELAFSWLAARREVASVIAGAMTPEQVRANAAAVDWKLSADDLAELDRLLAER